MSHNTLLDRQATHLFVYGGCGRHIGIEIAVWLSSTEPEEVFTVMHAHQAQFGRHLRLKGIVDLASGAHIYHANTLEARDGGE